MRLAAEAKYTIHLRAGLCDDGTPAVFADSYTEERNRLVTDLVVELDSGLHSMTQGLAASAAATLRRSTAFCTDINGDGVLEIPVDIEDFPYWLPGSTQFLRWCDFSNENTGPVELLYTFYMSNEGLALVVPKHWGEGMQVTRWKDEANRTVYSFYETSYAGDEEVRPRNETLVLRLCIGEAYRLDEMPYDNIVIREEIAIGYEIPENAPEDMRLEKYEIEYGLHLLQDRW